MKPDILKCLSVVLLLATSCGAEAVDPTDTDAATEDDLTGEIRLWPAGTVPAHPSVRDSEPVELGVKFKSSVAGRVTGLRFYKGTGNSGEHTGHLWTRDGQLLASVTFENETATGWQRARFATPVQIQADLLYVASYFAPRGRYAGDTFYFLSKGRSSGPLSAPRNDEAGGNGTYRYGATSGFPGSSWNASNYYVDVLFVPETGASPPPPPPAPVPDAGTPPPAVPDAGTAPPPDAGTPRPDAGTTPTALRDCAARPSACGYPDDTNTGPVAGTVFRRVPEDVTSGPGWAWESNFRRLRVTGTNADLNGLSVTGPVVIDAPGVTLRNSIVTACDSESDVVAVRGGRPSDGYDGRNARILNNRLRCATAGMRARSGIRDVYGGATNLVAQGNDISGTGNGITIEGSGLASDNWIHDLGHLSGDHHSGLSNHGGSSGVTYRHNTALLANTPTSGGGGLSGAITIYGDFARAQNVTVEDNLVSGGAYTFYGGINNESVYGQPLEIHIDRNRLVCGSWIYGPVFRRTGLTDTFNNNLCDKDGAAVGG